MNYSSKNLNVYFIFNFFDFLLTNRFFQIISILKISHFLKRIVSQTQFFIFYFLKIFLQFRWNKLSNFLFLPFLFSILQEIFFYKIKLFRFTYFTFRNFNSILQLQFFNNTRRINIFLQILNIRQIHIFRRKNILINFKQFNQFFIITCWKPHFCTLNF